MMDECHVQRSEEDEVSDVAHKVDDPNVEERDRILHIGKGQCLELHKHTRHTTHVEMSAKQCLE